jgi:hypothetical protein
MPLRSNNMSESPQNDDVINEEVNTEVATNDSTLESDTSNQVQDESNEQVDEVEVAKQKANEAFNKQYGQLKQAERERDALQAKQDKFEQDERQRQANLVSDIPAMPDAFDDDYEAKVKNRDEAIVAQANYNAQNQAYMQQQQFSQQQAAQVKQDQLHTSMGNYSKKAVELGIEQNELQAAGNKVASYGLSDDLVMHILADTDGPLITKHLAANPQEGYELASMSPYSVGKFLDGIKVKAGALKPRTSSTTSPATNLQGNGASPSDGYNNIKGAKFE